MTLDKIKNQLPEAIKDTKINFERIFTEESVLTQDQIALIALSCSYTLAQTDLLITIKDHYANIVNENLLNAAKICASLMAMNNIYYRYTHLVQDKSLSKMNPNLRMSGLNQHGVNPIDFELAALAVSALNGCGLCMDAHTEKLKKEHVSLEQIQASVRIAAVLNAAGMGLRM